MNLQRAKRDFGKAKFNLMKTKVTSGVDDYANQVQSLLAQGRRNRVNAGGAKQQNAGKNLGRRLTFLEEGPIAEVASFLDPVQLRENMEQWVRKLIPAQVESEIVNLIDPTNASGGLTKIDINIGDSLMELTFPESLLFNGEECPLLVKEYMRVIVGLMEKFCQQEEAEMSFLGRSIQLVLCCKLITSSENGLTPPSFDIDGTVDDAVTVSTNYVVSLGESPKLRLGFQDIGGLNADVTRDINQDKLTIWRNDALAHRIEAEGAGTALLLSIGLVDPHDLPVFD